MRYVIKPTRAFREPYLSTGDSNGLEGLQVMMIRLVVVVVVVVVVASALARGAGAQTPAQRPAVATPVGTWRGTSTCLVRPSSCNDEIIVYRIARMNGSDSLTLDARKIVRGQEEEMGVLSCRYPEPIGPLTCVMPQGTWQFRVRNDSLVGELRLTNNTKFRDVRTVRAP